MKAAIFKEKEVLRVEEVPEPQAGPRDVLLKITHCAICGSDLHRYQHAMMSPGTIMGHEYSGVVADKGAEVSEFAIGDRATRSGGPPHPVRDVFPLGARYSAKERGFMPSVGPGAYAEYMVTPADRLMKLPETVTNLDASLVEPLTVSLHAVRLSNLKVGDRALIVGAGPIGLLAQQCVALGGARAVYVSETNAARREVALKLGADEVFDPREVDLVAEIIERTGVGVDLVIECAGAYPTLQQSLEALRVAGQVVVVSLAWEQVQCTPVDWVGREVEMKAVYGSHAGE